MQKESLVCMQTPQNNLDTVKSSGQNGWLLVGLQEPSLITYVIIPFNVNCSCFLNYHKTCIKPNIVFEHAQNVQIQIILHMLSIIWAFAVQSYIL